MFMFSELGAKHQNLYSDWENPMAVFFTAMKNAMEKNRITFGVAFFLHDELTICLLNTHENDMSVILAINYISSFTADVYEYRTFNICN